MSQLNENDQDKSANNEQYHHHHLLLLSRIRPFGLFRFRIYFLKLMNLWTFGRTPWMGDRLDARPLPTHRTTQHRKTRTLIHASSGIRNQDPSVRAAEDSTCLRPRGHWNSLINNIYIIIFQTVVYLTPVELLRIRAGVKVKGKVVCVLFLTEHHTMKPYWVSVCVAPRIL
jgi:hypothetical protein